jgi:hypothetical protein
MEEENRKEAKDFIPFVEKSMSYKEIIDTRKGMETGLREKEKEKEKMEASFLDNPNVSLSYMQEYVSLCKERKTAINKRKKEVDKEIEKRKDQHKNIDFYCGLVEKYNSLCQDIEREKGMMKESGESFERLIEVLLFFLQKEGFISRHMDGSLVRTAKGHIATHIREVHCLVFAELLSSNLIRLGNSLDGLSTEELVGLLSCFTNVTVADELRTLYKKEGPLEDVLGRVASFLDTYERFEGDQQIDTGMDVTMHYDLIEGVMEWCKAESVEDCKWVLQELERKKGIFLGEFVKAIMKINNSSAELEKVAEDIGNLALLQKLKEIPVLTQKYVATNQSLYI